MAFIIFVQNLLTFFAKIHNFWCAYTAWILKTSREHPSVTLSLPWRAINSHGKWRGFVKILSNSTHPPGLKCWMEYIRVSIFISAMNFSAGGSPDNILSRLSHLNKHPILMPHTFSLLHPFIHPSFIHSFIHPSISPSIHSFVHPSDPSFLLPSIHSSPSSGKVISYDGQCIFHPPEFIFHAKWMTTSKTATATTTDNIIIILSSNNNTQLPPSSLDRPTIADGWSSWRPCLFMYFHVFTYVSIFSMSFHVFPFLSTSFHLFPCLSISDLPGEMFICTRPRRVGNLCIWNPIKIRWMPPSIRQPSPSVRLF